MELRAEKVTRRYLRETRETNIFEALKETDLTLAGGTLVEITGRSGSGKSTLLNMLAGLLCPTTGRVLLDGQDLYTLPDGERSRLRGEKIGIIPQGQTGLRSLTVLENVLLPCRMYGLPADEGRAGELLRRLDIEALRDAYPHELSGGELRRLAIARAMIRAPGVLLCDEPTADLDDGNTREVLQLLRETADAGTAVLLVTHEREAAAYADRVYRMNSGVLTAE